MTFSVLRFHLTLASCIICIGLTDVDQHAFNSPAPITRGQRNDHGCYVAHSRNKYCLNKQTHPASHDPSNNTSEVCGYDDIVIYNQTCDERSPGERPSCGVRPLHHDVFCLIQANIPLTRDNFIKKTWSRCRFYRRYTII